MRRQCTSTSQWKVKFLKSRLHPIHTCIDVVVDPGSIAKIDKTDWWIAGPRSVECLLTFDHPATRGYVKQEYWNIWVLCQVHVITAGMAY